MTNRTFLLKGAQVYSPEKLGELDIYIAGERILAMDTDISILSPYLEIIDCANKLIVPGFIDGHVHLTGGGGEGGFETRVPPCKISELLRGGLTTVLGLFGTDSLTRSIESLLAKAKSLEEAGITTYILTGAYTYPSPTISGSVIKDIAFIDKVIGVKIAISDHRSSFISTSEFARLCSEARVGGLIGGKAGLVVAHMGPSKKHFTPIYEMLEYSDLPLANILPTHCGRSDSLSEEAIKYALLGGNIDITAGQKSESGMTAAAIVAQALEAGVPIERLTISSDNYGSQPIFDDLGTMVGVTYSRAPVIYKELVKMVTNYDIPLEQALLTVTQNVAKRMKIDTHKGILKSGYDADLLVLNHNLEIEKVIAKGKLVWSDGESLVGEMYD